MMSEESPPTSKSSHPMTGRVPFVIMLRVHKGQLDRGSESINVACGRDVVRRWILKDQRAA